MGPGPDKTGFSLRPTPSPGLAALVGLGWLPLMGLAGYGSNGTGLAPLLLPLIGATALYSALRYVRPERLTGGGLLLVKERQLYTGSPGEQQQEWRIGRESRLAARFVWLEVVTASPPHRRQRLLLTDMPGLANLPRDDFRQLKVWLRLAARYH